MKIEITTTLTELRATYIILNREYEDECARDFMSRRAAYLDGQLATLHRVIELLEDAIDEVIAEEALEDFDEEDFDFEDDVDETNYNPYMGCDCFDD